jgi:hypothetical protein
MISNEEIINLELLRKRLEVLKEIMLQGDEPPLITFEWALKNILGFTNSELEELKKKFPDSWNQK